MLIQAKQGVNSTKGYDNWKQEDVHGHDNWKQIDVHGSWFIYFTLFTPH